MKYTSDQVKRGYWSWFYGGSVWHRFVEGRTLCGKSHFTEHSRRDSGRPSRTCPKCEARLVKLEAQS